MSTKCGENAPLGIYTPGINQEKEAVISSHFMHDINQNLNLMLYSPIDFAQRALTISANLINERLIPSLLATSEQFIVKRASAAKIRARKNFKEYGCSAQEQVGISEIITEAMFDRQFLKGPKSNCSRLILSKKIKALVEKQEPIKMVIPALPYKSSSPLKSRGIMPDLSEINFLLGLSEIVKTIALIYQEEMKTSNKIMAKFTVISDGSRFNAFLNESNEAIKAYQDKLRWWIVKLNIFNYVEIVDYQFVIENYLSKELYLEKKIIKDKVYRQYTELMIPLFEPCNIAKMISRAIELDPDPEACNLEGRFIPLFKSLIYIVRYKSLIKYAQLNGDQYEPLYAELIRNIFVPYTELKEGELALIEEFIANPQQNIKPEQIQCYEYLRQTMLYEAWQATINYIAEIRSDRDLDFDPIGFCFVNYIRWTIHAKSGQMAILITTANGDPIQAWHGAGVFKLTKNNKIKIYTLPTLLLEGEGATPVIIANDGVECIINDQPLFYIHREIIYKNSDDLFEKIDKHLTRNRKF